MKDVLIPYRSSDGGAELRYALRSIAKNLPHGKVYIVGDSEPWFSDELVHVPKMQYVYAFNDAEMNIRKGIKSELSEDFYFFNDDFYVLKPIKSIPNYHLGTLQSCLEERLARTGRSSYTDAIKKTMNYLKDRGYNEPLNYSAHIPCVLNKHNRRTVSNTVLDRLARGDKLLVRAIYGNIYYTDPVYTPDVKVYDITSTTSPGVPQFISSNQLSFNNALGKHLQAMFPQPSKYERTK